MDPMSAFALAVNVVTVIDISLKIVSAYKSENAVDYTQLQEYASGLEDLCGQFVPAIQSPSATPPWPTGDSLRKCAEKSIEISKSLQQELTSLQPGGSKLKRVVAALKNPFSQKIKNLERDLRNIQADLDTRLLLDLRLVDLIHAENEQTRHAIINELRSWKATGEQKELSDRKSRILESLIHGNPFTRQNEINVQHDGTFEWLLKDLAGGRSDFSDWLQRGNGIFWIQGKPGSGKSTLMKFISGSSDVLEGLNVWAESKTPLVITFYFWLADSSGLQNSFKGFLCSILYQLLLSHWVLDESYLADHQLHRKKRPDNWDLIELENLTQQAAIEISTIAPIFFIIDGLDECKEDDFRKVIGIIQQFDSNSNLKFCVSSRPEGRIKTRLVANRVLKVEEYTRKDVEKYVTDELGPLRRQSNFDDNGWQKLVNEIVSNSDGVFLWSILVSRDICKGIENGDRSSQILERLRKLPTDITNLYEEMLKRVGGSWEFYKHEAASYFRLLQYSEYLEFRELSSRRKSWSCIPPGLGGYMPIYEQFNVTNSSQTIEEEIEFLSKIKRRIDIVCAGMVAVDAAPDRSIDISGGVTKEEFYLRVWEGRVRFVHRTASDFFKETGRSILHFCTTTGIQIYTSLVDNYIRLQRRGYRPDFSIPEVVQIIRNLESVEGTTEEKLKFLKYFEGSMSSLLSTADGEPNDNWVYDLSEAAVKMNNNREPSFDFNAVIIEAAPNDVLESWIDALLTSAHMVGKKLNKTYKDYLLFCGALWRRSTCIRKLLLHDADPNALFYWGVPYRGKTSPWLIFIGRILMRTKSASEFFDIIKLFLDSGASLDSKTVVMRTVDPAYTSSFSGSELFRISDKHRAYFLEVNAQYLLRKLCQILPEATDALLRQLNSQVPLACLRLIMLRPAPSDYSVNNSEELQAAMGGPSSASKTMIHSVLNGLQFDRSLALEVHPNMSDNTLDEIYWDHRRKPPYRIEEEPGLREPLETVSVVNWATYLKERGYLRDKDDPAVGDAPIPMFDGC
ncbi:hypothetical protein ABW19_dt0200939 [Dactylella cylindrospora]|nr:hypothetical protein ABW19_dt0200939 [Dactylella cylindrospora]